MSKLKLGALLLTVAVLITTVSMGAEKKLQQSKINAKGFTSSEVCATCHNTIHKYWKSSMHAMSMSDPIFAVAHMQARAVEGPQVDAFCYSCHSPTTNTTKDYNLNDPISKEGITCDFCHTVTSVNLKSDKFPYTNEPGLTKRSVIKQADSPVHRVQYSDLFAKAEFCAGCHELKSKSGALVLGTYTEWREGPYSKPGGKQCQDCHMPSIEGPVVDPKVKVDVAKNLNKHDVSGSHNLIQLKKAAVVKIIKVNRDGDNIAVQVEVSNHGSGHKIPTGIPTRKLVLKVCAQGNGANPINDCKEIVYEKVLVDAKGKELTADHEAMLYANKIKRDNRISPGESRNETLTVNFPKGQEALLKVELYYLYKPLVIDTSEMKIKLSESDQVLTVK